MKKKPPSSCKFSKGDEVICIINSRASLTIGKEYKILEVYGHSTTDIQEVWETHGNEITLVIQNDSGEQHWYDNMRFVPKSDFRQHIINDILKK